MAEKNGEGHVAGEVQRQQEDCWQLAEEWPVQLDLAVILQPPRRDNSMQHSISALFLLFSLYCLLKM